MKIKVESINKQIENLILIKISVKISAFFWDKTSEMQLHARLYEEFDV